MEKLLKKGYKELGKNEAEEADSIMIKVKEADSIENNPSVEKLLKKGYKVLGKNEADAADSIMIKAKKADSIENTPSVEKLLKMRNEVLEKNEAKEADSIEDPPLFGEAAGQGERHPEPIMAGRSVDPAGGVQRKGHLGLRYDERR